MFLTVVLLKLIQLQLMVLKLRQIWYCMLRCARIVEIPIRYKRPSGSVSKLNTFTDGARVLTTIGQILRHYRPLKFFGFAAIFMTLLGLLAGTPVILEWLNTGFISHIPLAILATGLELIATIFIAIGLILDSVADQNRRNFEQTLLLLDSR